MVTNIEVSDQSALDVKRGEVVKAVLGTRRLRGRCKWRQLLEALDSIEPRLLLRVGQSIPAHLSERDGCCCEWISLLLTKTSSRAHSASCK